ncbi:CCR4-NOT transcription complex [Lophiostoma macrostomum CBS 122681]|uniref:General negative regulator of transcription subunit n=1 Tax=Lophiostoma macrostomum CBS 122681 TaxID=1314788 RepID=A0A6A6T3T3_9PLEO|nr:CCR4-NOT transcription complex [Lophiostoma macrostomum CBS 122681]
MAARKLQQEIDKCFKKVSEGVAIFENIHDKIQQTTNPSQKEKLEDALKKEIKKLQRSRDQIKTWATMSEIKDKKPLLDQRKLIETQMERFKAVEKEMKTKAYSKEGLQLASKLDPKEKEKMEVADFLSNMNEELERQVETIEAEVETLQAGMKKGKKDTQKAERISELEETVERHKWHQGKLELLQRALDNGNVEVEQVKEIEDSIRYYVDSNQEVDFMEDDTIYDDFALQEEEAMFGMGADADHVSSQDTQSIQDDSTEQESRSASLGGGKVKPTESVPSNTRRPSTQMKSPLPALATLHTPLPGVSSSTSSSMKPAPLPTRTPGEPLKYASAAAAAAASDKNGVGIAPLPPPPGAAAAQASLAPSGARTSATTSPASSHPQPAQRPQVSTADSASLVHSAKSPAASVSIPATPALEKESLSRVPSADDGSRLTRKISAPERVDEEESTSATPPLTNGESHAEDEEEESVYHLPASLQDLLDTFEATKNDISASASKPPDERLLAASMSTAPDSADTEAPRHYRPQNPYPYTPSHYPQEPLAIFDDPRLYQRIETDALFYAFYYRQGTYQQYLAAKALKSQSWRFHKQYQTWFQRHEEPKAITEDYEQGTYRFFDYESTWMNRRKQDFRFAYKFLEDEL